MALSVNSNIQALNAYRNLNKTQSAMSNSLEKLSSGLRINRAADDAAGLAISENLKAQIGGIQQASKNAQDGVSLVQTADGALATVHTLLQRLRTLAIQSANGSQSSSSRSAINAEAVALKAELTRISQTSNFNGVNLLDGTFKSAVNFQIGYRADDAANGVQGNKIAVSLDSGAAALTVNAASATKAAAIAGVAASANVTTDYDFSMTGATFTAYTTGASQTAAAGASYDFSGAGSYLTVGVKLDGVAASLLVASSVGSLAGLASALQTQIDGAFGAGRVTVSSGATSGLIFTAGAKEKAGATSTFQVVATSVAAGVGLAASFGLAVGAGTSGTASRALSLDVTVDGTTKTLSVSSNTYNQYGLVAALNTAANTAFGNNQAVFAASGNTITFASGASANTGSTSSVKIGAITLGDANSSVVYGLASNTTSTGTDAVTAATTKAGAFDSNGLGVGALDLSNQASAQAAVGLIDAAITQVSTSRASLGALQNRFQYTVDNLDTTAENLSSAQSRILDTDMASEMVSFTRSQILSQAGSAMLSQAKNLPSSLLELLTS